MSQPSSPRTYALQQLHELDRHWSAVHDGDVEGVHEARVATRRIRAALPFVPGVSKATRKEIRRMGRALGRVRELDVTDAWLTTFERRVRRAPVAISLLREHVQHQLADERRRMIKTLDRQPRAIAHDIAHGGFAQLSSIWRDWRYELGTGIVSHADEVEAAVQRATAVYMPNRSHAARIALKKLRYLTELAADVGLLKEDDVLENMKRAQEALGELNDLHVVARLVERFDIPKAAEKEEEILAAVVDAEAARVHEKYVRQRDRLFAVCRACRRLAPGRGAHVVRLVARALPAAGLAALPIVTSLLGHGAVREWGAAGSPDETRIPRRHSAARSSREALRPVAG
jgi:CHAD domain-containing protein